MWSEKNQHLLPNQHQPTLVVVGDKAISAKVQATSLMMKNLCMSKTRYAKMERERDRHKGRYVLCLKNNNNKKYNNQPLLKVTMSFYIVTVLGQLPFTLFTEIAQTWAFQRDSVNTAIIHSYSTVGSMCNALSHRRAKCYPYRCTGGLRL